MIIIILIRAFCFTNGVLGFWGSGFKCCSETALPFEFFLKCEDELNPDVKTPLNLQYEHTRPLTAFATGGSPFDSRPS